MRNLVTGSCSYIGAVLMPELAAKSHEVVGLDTRLYKGSLFGDSTDVDQTLDLDFQGPDASTHLAGLKAAGVQRFLFASSCSNYGAAKDDFLDKSSTLRPLTPYAKSKVDTEEGVRCKPGFDPQRQQNGTAGRIESARYVLPARATVGELQPRVDDFSTRISAKPRYWDELIGGALDDGLRIAKWGAGSKAVSFLYTIDMGAEIPLVVNINPYSEGHFIAEKAQRIVGP